MMQNVIQYVKNLSTARVYNNWIHIEWYIKYEFIQNKRSLISVHSIINYVIYHNNGKTDAFDKILMSKNDYNTLIKVLKQEKYKIIQKPFLFFWKRDYVDLRDALC